MALALSVVGFFIITQWLLNFEEAPGAALKFFFCGVVGMVCAYIIVLSTQVSDEPVACLLLSSIIACLVDLITFAPVL